MAPDTTQTILKAEQIRKGSVVMDLITYPVETELLRQAKKAGAQVIDGSRMLLHQAAGQFTIWFEKPAPLEAMETAMNAELKRRA
jgi:shikimate dehydrogenase